MKRAYDFLNNQSSFEAKSFHSRKRSCDSSSIMSYNINNNSRYMDTEKLREELIHWKIQYNKKSQDYHELRIEMKKIESEKLQFTHLIKDLISEANKNLLISSQDIIELDDDRFIKTITNNISKESAAKIFNQYLLIRMKDKIYQLREEIKKKNAEIFEWKTKTKVVKYTSLDNQLAQTSLELAKVKDKYHKANKLQREMQYQASNLMYNLNIYQREFRKQSIRLDKSNRDISVIEKLNESKEYRSHSRINNDNYNNNNVPSKAKEKNEKNIQYINKSYSNRIENLENELNAFKERNIQLEMKINQYKEGEKRELNNKTKEQLKEEIKQKDIKIKKLEDKICDYYIELEKEKNKKPPVRNYIKIEKDNYSLKVENRNFKKINEDLKKELLKFKLENKIGQENDAAINNNNNQNQNEYNNKYNNKLVENRNNNDKEENHTNVLITRDINDVMTNARHINIVNNNENYDNYKANTPEYEDEEVRNNFEFVHDKFNKDDDNNNIEKETKNMYYENNQNDFDQSFEFESMKFQVKERDKSKDKEFNQQNQKNQTINQLNNNILNKKKVILKKE